MCRCAHLRLFCCHVAVSQMSLPTRAAHAYCIVAEELCTGMRLKEWTPAGFCCAAKPQGSSAACVNSCSTSASVTSTSCSSICVCTHVSAHAAVLQRFLQRSSGSGTRGGAIERERHQEVSTCS